MPNLEKGKIYAIAGHMGSGKSELLNQLSKLGVVVFGELPVGKNPHFGRYSTALRQGIKPNPHVLDSQKAFLAASVDQAREIAQLRANDPEVTIVWEMPPWGHFMFAWLQHLAAEGDEPIMSAQDWEEYCLEFKSAWQQIIELGVLPDVVIVTLLKDIEVLMGRIDERGRPEEKDLPIDFVLAQSRYWVTLLNEGTLMPSVVLEKLGFTEEEAEKVVPKVVVLDAQKFDWTEKNPQGVSDTLNYIHEMVA